MVRGAHDTAQQTAERTAEAGRRTSSVGRDRAARDGPGLGHSRLHLLSIGKLLVERRAHVLERVALDTGPERSQQATAARPERGTIPLSRRHAVRQARRRRVGQSPSLPSLPGHWTLETHRGKLAGHRESILVE